MTGYFLNFDKIDYVRGERYRGCILCGLRDHDPNLIDLSVHKGKYFTITVNLYPYNPGHLLIYPHRHVLDIRELNTDEVIELHMLQTISLDLLDKAQSPRAYNIGYNMGAAAGGSIDHLHLHIIPRYEREVGIADLIAGQRVLIESPFTTADKFRKLIEQSPDMLQST